MCFCGVCACGHTYAEQKKQLSTAFHHPTTPFTRLSWIVRVPLLYFFLHLSQMYEHQHQKPMSTAAIAQCLSNTLYFRRFFPFYVTCVIAGLDEEGECNHVVSVTREWLQLQC